MTKRFIALEVAPSARLIAAILNEKRGNLSLPIAQINTKKATQIVGCLIRSILNTYSTFIENPSPMDLDIGQIMWDLPCSELTTKHLEVTNLFIESDVVKEITHDLTKQINTHIRLGTYTVWDVVCEDGFIGLLEGQDYRITEYLRITNTHNDDSESIFTLNIENIIEYLNGRFRMNFQPAITTAVRTIGNEIHTLTNLSKARFDHNSVMFTRLPEDIRKSIEFTFSKEDYKTSPEVIEAEIVRWLTTKIKGLQRHLETLTDSRTMMAGLFIDILTDIYPNIELDRTVPGTQEDVLKAVGVWDLEDFKDTHIRNAVKACGTQWFATGIERDKRYTLEWCYPILAVYEKAPSTMEDAESQKLLASFINGDYLKPSERAIAERLYLEQIQ